MSSIDQLSKLTTAPPATSFVEQTTVKPVVVKAKPAAPIKKQLIVAKKATATLKKKLTLPVLKKPIAKPAVAVKAVVKAPVATVIKPTTPTKAAAAPKTQPVKSSVSTIKLE